MTGAAGFLGGHVLRQLVDQGVEVVALVRRDEDARRLRDAGAEPVAGDLADAGSLAAAFARPVDSIFHIAADTSSWKLANAAQTRTNVDGTRHLLAAARSAGVRRFVHTSSVAAFGRVEHSALFEALPRLGIESWINYERTKAAAELLVRDAGQHGWFETVTLNPAHILGPGDRRNWARLFLMIDRRELPGAPPGSGVFADVREVARAHVAAWRDGRSGESWLLGGVQASYLELVQRVAAELGRPAPQKPLPQGLLSVYAKLAELASHVTRRAPSVTPETVALTARHLRVDSRKAEAQLDYRTPPLDVLIRDTLDWLRNEGLLRPR
jgi:nucleoside-diphosphate-sugar epimerase